MARFPTIRLFSIQTVCFTGNSNTQTTSPNNHVILETTSRPHRHRHRHTTPLTGIPATLRSCAWLTKVQGRDKVWLPRNIAPRQTKITTRDTIWAKIESPPASSIANQIFVAHEQIHLDATIPDIDRPVNNFNHSRAIIIRYPLFLEPGRIKCLESIPFGSSCSIKWPVSRLSSCHLKFSLT
jgi:hypothetical protein